MSSKPSALWHHFENLEQQHDANVLGMWVFLSTELLLFGALFTGYTIYRIQYEASFEEASKHLKLWIGAINTGVLLTSSLTMALAVRAAKLGQQRALVLCLVLTALFGAAFLGIKAFEYYSDYQEKLVPRLAFDPADPLWHRESVTPEKKPVTPENVQLFLVFYYVMTGLHAVHLTIAIGVMIALAFMAWRGAFTTEHYAPIEIWGLYWHFVDIVWIFLLPLLYLVGEHS